MHRANVARSDSLYPVVFGIGISDFQLSHLQTPRRQEEYVSTHDTGDTKY